MSHSASLARVLATLAVLAFVAGCATNAPPSSNHSRSSAMSENEKRRLMEQTDAGRMCSQRPMGTFAGLPH